MWPRELGQIFPPVLPTWLDASDLVVKTAALAGTGQQGPGHLSNFIWPCSCSYGAFFARLRCHSSVSRFQFNKPTGLWQYRRPAACGP